MALILTTRSCAHAPADLMCHMDIGRLDVSHGHMGKDAASRWKRSMARRLPQNFRHEVKASYSVVADCELISSYDMRLENTFRSEAARNDGMTRKIYWRRLAVVDLLVDVEVADARGLVRRGEACPSQLAAKVPVRAVVNHTASRYYVHKEEDHRLAGPTGERIKQ